MLRNRAGETKDVSPTAAVVLLVVLAGFMLFILSLPEADRNIIIEGIDDQIDSSLLISIAPGDVASDVVLTGAEKLEIPRFVLDSAVSSEDSVIANAIVLSANIFKGATFTLTFNPDLSSDVIGNELNLFVEEYTGKGEFNVLVNGAKIFSGEATAGQNLKIYIPSTILLSGANVLTLEMRHTGLNIFKSAYLLLSDVTLRTNKFGSKTDYSYSFNVDSSTTIDSLKFDALVKNYRPENFVPLRIKLNGNEIYNAVSTGSLSITIPAEYARSDTNALSFNIGSGASYELFFPTLTYKTSSFEGSNEYFFNVKGADATLIVSEKVECILDIEKSAGQSNTVIVNINSFSTEYTFSGNSLKDNVCDRLVYGRNSVSFGSKKTLELSSASITLE